MAWLVRGLPPPLEAASRSSSAPVDLVARWQDELLHAILDVDAGALEQALDTHGAKAIHAVLERREVQKQGVFYIADQMYPKYGALRDVLGGDYWFEDEEQRSAISTWLDMIGAQTGDTMLHLVMRLNGCADEAKVACAVELIGRGMDWEKPNKAGTLAPQIDPPAFKATFLRALPKWKVESHQKKVAAAAKAAEDARGELNERRLAQERAEAQRRKAQWAKVREMQTELEEKEEQRDRFHRRLNSALEKLERREQRAAKGHDIFSDLGDGLKRMTSGADRLLKSVGL